MALLESLMNIPVGEMAHDFALQGVDGQQYALKDFAESEVLVVVFMCNHCPYVQAVWPRLVALQEKYRERGVQFVGINPNLHPEYPDETFEKMQEYAERYEMNFPYLQDDSQNIARVYKAQCTPDVFVYDHARGLAYHGRIDDNWQDESAVTHHELDEALHLILHGEPVSLPWKPAMGCSIKWRG